MVKCFGCGQQLQGERKKWCSDDCRKINYKREMKTGICEECKNTYEYAVYREGRTRFCSKKCLGKSYSRKNNKVRIVERIEVTCKQCSKKYLKTNYQAKRSRFCCKKCQNKYQSIHHRGKNNRAYTYGKKCYRRLALEYYGNICKVCGCADNIEVHHKDRNRSNNEIQNLIPVCKSCHRLIHKLAIKGARYADFVEECPSMDYYYNFVLPLIGSYRKKK